MCCLSNFRFGRCNIQSAFIRAIDRMLDDLETYRRLSDFHTCDVEMDDETKSLIDAGFMKNKKVVDYYKKIERTEDLANSDSEYRKELNDSCDYIACLVAAREAFGNDVLFLPTDTFKNIIKEYGVNCYAISEYDKDIPERKLYELATLRQKAKEHHGSIVPIKKVTSVKRLYYTFGEREYNEIKRKLNGFPFVSDLECRYITKVLRYLDGGSTIVDDTSVTVSEIPDFFLLQPNNVFRNDGPFFCAYNGMGLLIFMRPTETGGRKAFKRMMYLNMRLKSLCFE